MVKEFCWVNADCVPLQKLVHDLERAYMEASVAGYNNIFTALDIDGAGKTRLYVKGDKE